LVCNDPDASTSQPFVHWVIYGIPADTDGLPKGLPAQSALDHPEGAKQGQNSFGRIGYGGPAPPKGHGTHPYHFTLYALDSELDLAPGASKAQLMYAMEGHVLAAGELVGTYEW